MTISAPRAPSGETLADVDSMFRSLVDDGIAPGISYGVVDRAGNKDATLSGYGYWLMVEHDPAWGIVLSHRGDIRAPDLTCAGIPTRVSGSSW
ncbi:MAG: hypothetical protein ACRDTD_19685 [Pseudonocardiaceae bacterium]